MKIPMGIQVEHWRGDLTTVAVLFLFIFEIICLYVPLCFYLSTYPRVCLNVSLCLSIYMSICLSSYQSIYVNVFVCVSYCPSLSIHLCIKQTARHRQTDG